MRYHSSSMETYERCQRKFYLQSQIPRADGSASFHLVAGSAFAKALEAARKAFYVDGADAGECHMLARETMLEAWGQDKMLHADTPKNLPTMLKALDKYLKHFPFTQDEYLPAMLADWSGIYSPAIEHKMRATLPNGEPYDGTPDMICEYGGLLWCLDDKTTGGRLDDQWRQSWLRRGQFLGYAWLAKEQYGIDVAGTIVRGVSVSRSAISVAETFVPTPQHLIDEWLSSTVARIEEQKRKKEYADYLPSMGVSCNAYNSPCEFLDKCLGKQEA